MQNTGFCWCDNSMIINQATVNKQATRQYFYFELNVGYLGIIFATFVHNVGPLIINTPGLFI